MILFHLHAALSLSHTHTQAKPSSGGLDLYFAIHFYS